MDSKLARPNAPSRNVDPNRLLYSLMIPAIIMPLTGWMFSVSLPIIRDDFQITADVAAWIATAFSLPFMILMPVYGRLSDSLGKRRLLLFGILLFTFGSILAFLSTNLMVLLVARIIQGFGIAGLLPISLALLTEVFPANELGKAMGLWSTVGPLTGVAGPILAGFIVATWGWRAAFLPPALFAIIGLIVIYIIIPASKRSIQLNFFSAFDWLGVLWLSLSLTFLLFYLSSRPITGVPPLQDWRLLGLTLLFVWAFVRREQKRAEPFIDLKILQNRSLVIASICASLRMMGLSGAGSFVTPLYLADIAGLNPTQSGFYLMTVPAAMVAFVRFGGRFSDRFGSRVMGVLGFLLLAIVMLGFSRLPSDVSPWLLIGLLLLFGIGAGLMLASFHRAALNNIPEPDLGTSSGVYSMIRFLGSATGAAIGGILLQSYLERFETAVLPAYQSVYLWFMGFALLGVLFSIFLPKSSQ